MTKKDVQQEEAQGVDYWINEVDYCNDAIEGARKGLSLLMSMRDYAKKKLAEFAPEQEEV